MAFNARSAPFSVPDPLGDAWDDMVRRNRILQARNDPYFASAEYAADAGDDGSNAPKDEAIADSGGQDLLVGGAGGDTVQLANRRPLTGRPGAAAIVAGALNTVVGGPNTSAPINVGGVDATVRRGAGRDLQANGRISIPQGPRVSFQASGVLDQPSTSPGVSLSGIRSATFGLTLPRSARVYNAANGELDAAIPQAVKVFGVPIYEPGVYEVPGRPF